MTSSRLRLCLVLSALLLSAGACDLNPQPVIPAAEGNNSPPGGGGGPVSGSGGSINLGPDSGGERSEGPDAMEPGGVIGEGGATSAGASGAGGAGDAAGAAGEGGAQDPAVGGVSGEDG